MRAFRRLSAPIFVCAVAWLPQAGARAADAMLPVPGVVIYPGDVIRDALLTDRQFTTAAVLNGVIDRRNALIGKVARRTLLPGQPIPTNAVDEPRLVTNGAQVRVVFQEGGLTIVTYGQALQAGSLGELIRVRNTDSGLTVSGTVQSDGTIRVSEG